MPKVSGAWSPFGPTDTYATGDANYMALGLHVVSSIEEMLSITPDRRKGIFTPEGANGQPYPVCCFVGDKGDGRPGLYYLVNEPGTTNTTIDDWRLHATTTAGLQGLFDPNTTTLTNETGTIGHWYIAKEAGTFNGDTYEKGDWTVYNGSEWEILQIGITALPPSAHTHPMSDVNGLQLALDNKLDKSEITTVVFGTDKVPTSQAVMDYAYSKDEVNSALDGKVDSNDERLSDARTPLAHTHPMSDISGLEATLSAKADLVGGKIPTSQIPSVSISEFLGLAANEAQMLALVGQRGDWCTRTDLQRDFILIADAYNLVGSWRPLQGGGSTNSGVTTVNGQTGDVILSKTDIGLGSVPNIDATNPANISQTASYRFVTDAEKATWNGKQNAIANGTAANQFLGWNGSVFAPRQIAYSDLSGTPTLGTAASKNVATSGNAGVNEVVQGNDTRLSDARTPLDHGHNLADGTTAGFSEENYSTEEKETLNIIGNANAYIIHADSTKDYYNAPSGAVEDAVSGEQIVLTAPMDATGTAINVELPAGVSINLGGFSAKADTEQSGFLEIMGGIGDINGAGATLVSSHYTSNALGISFRTTAATPPAYAIRDVFMEVVNSSYGAGLYEAGSATRFIGGGVYCHTEDATKPISNFGIDFWGVQDGYFRDYSFKATGTATVLNIGGATVVVENSDFLLDDTSCVQTFNTAGAATSLTIRNARISGSNRTGRALFYNDQNQTSAVTIILENCECYSSNGKLVEFLNTTNKTVILRGNTFVQPGSITGATIVDERVFNLRRTKTITANYTVTAADHNCTILVNAAAPIVVTLPTGISGADIIFKQVGAGSFEFSAGSGATVENLDAKYKSAGAKAVATVFSDDNNVWTPNGQLVA